MRRLFQERRADEGLGFMRLDLSDDTQYKFLLHRMMLSGKTPENSPRLFEGITRMRGRHLLKPSSQPIVGDEPVAATSQALEGDPCGQFLETPVVSDTSNSQIESVSRLNCFGGASFPYGYTDVATYETDETESYLTPLGYDATESFNGSADLTTPALTAYLSVNIGKFHFVDGISYTEDGYGFAFATYVSFKTPADNVSPTITVTHPAKFNGGGTTVRNCIKRAAWAGNGDCDYAGVDANGLPSQSAVGIAKMTYINGEWRADPSPTNRWTPTSGFAQFENLYIPLAGTFNAGSIGATSCNINSFAQARATLTYPGGGWCRSTGAGQYLGLKDELNKTENKSGNTSSFNVLGDFGPDCLGLVSGSANTVPVQLTIGGSVNVTCGASRPFSIVMKNKPLDFKDSCFARGTGILRADGKNVAVEDIKIGEKVIANDEGLALTVVSMSRGGEGKPLVQLFDDRGHSVLLTDKHPVITSDGIITADAAREGHAVETESGPAVVVEVERVEYSDLVYNLTLGTPEELAKVSADDRTMFAGGIRVGDNEMQLDLQRSSGPATRREVAAEWKVDHQNAVARRANVHVPQ